MRLVLDSTWLPIDLYLSEMPYRLPDIRGELLRELEEKSGRDAATERKKAAEQHGGIFDNECGNKTD